jgi:hypothetical protein
VNNQCDADQHQLGTVNNQNLTAWKPGQSGNGRPVGSRQAFSAGFPKDLAEVWQAEGKGTMLHTAKTQPATSLASALG